MARKAGIDKNVYIIVGVVILLLVLTIGFRVLTQKKCPNGGFTISTEEPISGQPIGFTDTTTGATTWDWDLGDNTKHEKTSTLSHTYYEPGSYTVSLIINGCPVEAKKITVINAPKLQPVDTVFPIKPIIDGPKTVTVGKKVQFFDKTENSNSSEWIFETGMVESREKNPYHTFMTPGKKVITLIVNGKSQQGRWEIMVLKDTSQRPKAGPKLPPPMNESEMSINLMKVAKRIIYPGYFQNTLCNGMDIPVSVNGKAFTFISYCNNIRVQAPESITVTEIARDSYGCPTLIKIKQEE